ncbi:MAG: hypothetical protein WCD46_01900, partial [Desulfobacterales bacterium]
MTVTASDLFPNFKATLSQTAPRLPPGELLAFVKHHFDRRHLYLRVLDDHPAPLYLQESAVLR